MEQLRGQNRAFGLHLCVKQVAELVGDILAVTNDSCRFVDESELRKTIRCVVVADGVNGDIHTGNDVLRIGEAISGIVVTVREHKDDGRAIPTQFLRFLVDAVHSNAKTVVHCGAAVRIEGVHGTLIQSFLGQRELVNGQVFSRMAKARPVFPKSLYRISSVNAARLFART